MGLMPVLVAALLPHGPGGEERVSVYNVPNYGNNKHKKQYQKLYANQLFIWMQKTIIKWNKHL